MKWLFGSILILISFTAQTQVLNQRPKEQPPQFVLGVGDEVTVRVANLDDLPTGPMRIGPNGVLDLPLVGQVQASGLTIDQFRGELAAKLTKYITSPDITVNLVDTESRPVSVVGEVSNPGLHQMIGEKRLLDVISMSGGLKPDAGPNVLVTRQSQWGKLNAGPVLVDSATGSSSTRLPLDTLLDLKSPEDNIVMQPGDVVSVPRADLIYIVGDVIKAGGFELTTHNTIPITHAVTLAQGLGPDNSAKNARIIRAAPNGDGSLTEIPVDIPKIFAGKAPDVKLYANDVLFIPHSGFKVGSRRAIEAAIGLTTGILIYH
ncbi:MAG: polysaccharide biosynthesis/export family protein [Janthinobacterium lividum]